MKILFDNILEDATLSAPNASPNYPVENLQHRFLKKRYQAIAASDTITIEWDEDQTIDCIFCEYTNAAAFVLRLYDSSDTLLDTITFTSSDLAQYFTAISGVRSVQIDLSNSLSSVYLGGVGLGQAYTMPDPINDWKDGLTENETVVTSADGQVLSNPITPLRTIPFNFAIYDYDEYKEIKALCMAAGKGTPLFVDPFESAHDAMLPIYAVISSGFPGAEKEDKKFPFSLTFQEAR